MVFLLIAILLAYLGYLLRKVLKSLANLQYLQKLYINLLNTFLMDYLILYQFCMQLLVMLVLLIHHTS